MTDSIACSARLACTAAIAATLATLPLSSSALAADMPPPAPVAAVSQWTGFYIGIHGGGGWGRSGLEDPDFNITYQPITMDSRGALAGAQVGANWQFGSFVIGGELDASWASIKGSVPLDNIFNGLSVQYQALATATGRVGYATGNFLGYAKGGVAWANVDYKTFTGTPFTLDVDHQRTGLTAGAGVEMALLSNLSARLEYDYIYFGANSISLGTRRNPSNVDHELHLLKLGVNWRFSGDYLTARY
jgi:outer membrane immunogenic protein